MKAYKTPQEVKDDLNARAQAYRRKFGVKDDQDAAAVLRDLAVFCRAHESTAHPNPHVAARLDGRREVWLRIQQHLQLNDDELWVLYGGPRTTLKG